MMELFLKRPIFPGSDEISQLDAIYKICGSPNVDEWPDIVHLPWYNLIRVNSYQNSFRPLCAEYTVSLIFRYGLKSDVTDLAEGLLMLNPNQRLKAANALKHLYFQERNDEKLPIFNLSEDWHEYDVKKVKKPC